MASVAYGGWGIDRPETGASPNRIKLIGWAVAGAAALSNLVGTGSEISVSDLQRTASTPYIALPSIGIEEVEPVRSPNENLARIREVFSPAVSDLATTLGVTRQSIYNWLKGEPVAEENAAKLRDLAQAADIIAHEGIGGTAALLKRKFSSGRTLFQVAQAGESARDAALKLVHIHKQEAAQRERMKARFANRPKSPATADFDFPAPNADV